MLSASAYHTIKFWTLVTILSLVLGIVAILAGLLDRSGDSAHRISSLWSRLVCRLNGIPVEIVGLENVLRDRAQIFVANHQSYFDIFTLSGFLPVQIRWMAKASLFRIPFVGWSMHASGYIPVDRSDRKKSYQAFMTAIEKLRQGKSIVIFPEGTRSPDETIGPFKKGSHLLAVRGQAPMVPVTIIGSGRIIRKRSGVIRPGTVKIIISPPISIQRIAQTREDQVLQTLRQTIIDNYRLHAGSSGGRTAQ